MNEKILKETSYVFKPIKDNHWSDSMLSNDHPDYKEPINYGEGIYYEEGMKIIHELRNAGLEGHLINNGFNGFTAIIKDESEIDFKKMIEIFNKYNIATDKYEIPKIENLKQEMREVGDDARLDSLKKEIDEIRGKNIFKGNKLH